MKIAKKTPSLIASEYNFLFTYVICESNF